MAKEKTKKKKLSRQWSRTINYPLGDFLIRIKNVSLARKKQVEVKNTKLIEDVAKALKKEGFLQEVEKKEGKLLASLAFRRKEPVLLGLKLVSKPGLRVYTDVAGLEKKRGLSVYLISTSKGIVSSRQAIKERIGGEVLVEVW